MEGHMMHRRALLAGGLALPATAHAFAFIADDALLPLLRAGGLNLYLRHAITDRAQVDTGRRGDRAGQRNLSEAGRQQALRLGQAIRALDIPVSEVLTSEVFRALDTAELAFGRAQIRVERDLIADDYTPGSASDDARAVSRRLAQPVQGGNRILVGHIVPLGMILGRGLAQQEFPEGAAGVFRPHGGDWAFLGFFRAEQLIGLAGLRP